MKLFAFFAGIFQLSDAMCTNGYDIDCKRECHDEFTECRRSGTIDYADCRSDRQECYELCVCHHTHREFVNIKHPVRSCPPPRSNECDFVKQQLTVAPDFFHHSEWRCEYECLTKA